MPPFGKYPRCTECQNQVTQVIDRIIKGKRITLCFSCARNAGWFDEDKEPEQGTLFKE
jgi:hypothetical protein